MRESSSTSNVMPLRQLRLQVERCIDADLLLPEDGQRLLSALDTALAARSSASAAARTEIAAFVDLVLASIAAGAAPTGEGQPPPASSARQALGDPAY
jgi:hypothetical protein